MGQLGVRIINIMLFTASCFFAAGVVNHVADSQLAPDYVAAFEPVDRPVAQPPSWSERSKILDRNLFGAKVGGNTLGQEVEPPPPPPEEEAQATKLPIELLGTIAGEPASISTAVINNTRKRKHQVVRIGDVLTDFEHVKVTAIEPRRVLLNNRNIVEELLLAKSPPASTSKSKASRRPQKSSALQRLRDRRTRGKSKRTRSSPARETRQEPVETSADELDMGQQMRKFQGIVAQGLIRDLGPAFNDQGEIEGVLVGDIADDSLLARAGLKPNDRLVSVNGTPISSAGEAAIALREIASGGPVSVEVDSGAGGTNTIEISAALIAELNIKP